MRFMIIVKATADTEAGVMPEESLMASMANYHEALLKAGVLLDGNGLLGLCQQWRRPFPTQQGPRRSSSAAVGRSGSMVRMS